MAELKKMTMEQLLDRRAELIGKFVLGDDSNKTKMALFKVEKEIRRRS